MSDSNETVDMLSMHNHIQVETKSGTTETVCSCQIEGVNEDGRVTKIRDECTFERHAERDVDDGSGMIEPGYAVDEETGEIPGIDEDEDTSYGETSIPGENPSLGYGPDRKERLERIIEDAEWLEEDLAMMDAFDAKEIRLKAERLLSAQT